MGPRAKGTGGGCLKYILPRLSVFRSFYDILFSGFWPSILFLSSRASNCLTISIVWVSKQAEEYPSLLGLAAEIFDGLALPW